jgi:hypothetical protein
MRSGSVQHSNNPCKIHQPMFREMAWWIGYGIVCLLLYRLLLWWDPFKLKQYDHHT